MSDRVQSPFGTCARIQTVIALPGAFQSLPASIHPSSNRLSAMNHPPFAIIASLAACCVLHAGPSRDATPLAMGTLPGTWKQDHDALIAGRDRWDVRGDFANARLHVEYLRPVAEASAKVMLGNGQTVPLDGAAGEWQTVDIASEQLPGQSGLVRVWRDGEEVSRVEIPVRATDKARGARFVSMTEKARKELRFDSDF